MNAKTICICGGGSLGHVVAGYISTRHKAIVNVLTRNPEKWNKNLSIILPDKKILTGNLHVISSNPKDVIPQSEVILFCLPGYAIPTVLDEIAPYVKGGTMLGTIFSSTGFFQEAFDRLPKEVGLWGFQRVPYVARVNEYGKSANLLSTRECVNVAVERCINKVEFSNLVEDWFGETVHLLGSWMEAAITNSNPLLHTSRLYTMFKDWNPAVTYPKQSLFYEEWTDEASHLLVKMDEELFSLIERLPVRKNFLDSILNHYEAKTPEDITKKLHSISGFKGITTPMLKTERGWIPDFNSRYFKEDFDYGLKLILSLCKENNIPAPQMQKVYDWYVIKSQK